MPNTHKRMGRVLQIEETTNDRNACYQLLEGMPNWGLKSRRKTENKEKNFMQARPQVARPEVLQ